MSFIILLPQKGTSLHDFAVKGKNGNEKKATVTTVRKIGQWENWATEERATGKWATKNAE